MADEVVEDLREAVRLSVAGNSPAPEAPAVAEEAPVAEPVPAASQPEHTIEDVYVRLGELTNVLQTLVGTLDGSFQQNLGNNIAQGLAKALEPRFAQFDEQCSEILGRLDDFEQRLEDKSDPTASKPPAKPEFHDAVFDAIGALGEDDRDALQGNQEGIEGVLSPVISKLKGSYPEVEKDTVKSEIIDTVEEHGIGIQKISVFLSALEKVLDEAYGSKGASFKLPFGGGRAKEPTAPKHASSFTDRFKGGAR
jgi:hypothetical protein